MSHSHRNASRADEHGRQDPSQARRDDRRGNRHDPVRAMNATEIGHAADPRVGAPPEQREFDPAGDARRGGEARRAPRRAESPSACGSGIAMIHPNAATHAIADDREHRRRSRVAERVERVDVETPDRAGHEPDGRSGERRPTRSSVSCVLELAVLEQHADHRVAEEQEREHRRHDEHGDHFLTGDQPLAKRVGTGRRVRPSTSSAARPTRRPDRRVRRAAGTAGSRRRTPSSAPVGSRLTICPSMNALIWTTPRVKMTGSAESSTVRTWVGVFTAPSAPVRAP